MWDRASCFICMWLIFYFLLFSFFNFFVWYKIFIHVIWNKLFQLAFVFVFVSYSESIFLYEETLLVTFRLWTLNNTFKLFLVPDICHWMDISTATVYEWLAWIYSFSYFNLNFFNLLFFSPETLLVVNISICSFW